jgi:hypothetical protein
LTDEFITTKTTTEHSTAKTTTEPDFTSQIVPDVSQSSPVDNAIFSSSTEVTITTLTTTTTSTAPVFDSTIITTTTITTTTTTEIKTSTVLTTTSTTKIEPTKQADPQTTTLVPIWYTSYGNKVWIPKNAGSIDFESIRFMQPEIVQKEVEKIASTEQSTKQVGSLIFRLTTQNFRSTMPNIIENNHYVFSTKPMDSDDSDTTSNDPGNRVVDLVTNNDVLSTTTTTTTNENALIMDDLSLVLTTESEFSSTMLSVTKPTKQGRKIKKTKKASKKSTKAEERKRQIDQTLEDDNIDGDFTTKRGNISNMTQINPRRKNAKKILTNW